MRADCKCGHGWIWHHEYDDELDQYVGYPCDHYSGCPCTEYRQEEEVDNEV